MRACWCCAWWHDSAFLCVWPLGVAWWENRKILDKKLHSSIFLKFCNYLFINQTWFTYLCYALLYTIIKTLDNDLMPKWLSKLLRLLAPLFWQKHLVASCDTHVVPHVARFDASKEIEWNETLEKEFRGWWEKNKKKNFFNQVQVWAVQKHPKRT
jgi:hypothetical protein